MPQPALAARGRAAAAVAYGACPHGYWQRHGLWHRCQACLYQYPWLAGWLRVAVRRRRWRMGRALMGTGKGMGCGFAAAAAAAARPRAASSSAGSSREPELTCVPSHDAD